MGRSNGSGQHTSFPLSQTMLECHSTVSLRNISRIKKYFSDLKKMKMHLPYNPATPLGIFSNQTATHVYQNVHTAPIGVQMPPPLEQMNKPHNIPAVKMNEPQQLAVTVMLYETVIMDNSHEHDIK